MKKLLFIIICLLMITGCSNQELNNNDIEKKQENDYNGKK